MDALEQACTFIRDGGKVKLRDTFEHLRRANARLVTQSRVEHLHEGNTVVIGPIRGHASDFANCLLLKVIPNKLVKNVVLLGDYVDGAHCSVEVLHILTLLLLQMKRRVVALVGKHELLYPVRPNHFGSLHNEIVMRASQEPSTGLGVEDYDSLVKEFFSLLPVSCVVHRKYLCVSGGVASTHRTLSQMEAETSQEALREFVLNRQMDEEEERMAEGCAFVASPNDLAFRYTYNAACNFISRNHLVMMIVGMEYHTHRPDYDSFAHQNHYKASIFFPGYIFGRLHPDTHLPAVLAIFSAPYFCSVNHNDACLVEIVEGELRVEELQAYAGRPLTMPGFQDHAFSWSQPMLERALLEMARELMCGRLGKQSDDAEELHTLTTAVRDSAAVLEAEEMKRREAIAVTKMRRMCQLLKSHGLPLPKLPTLQQPTTLAEPAEAPV